jgi:acyl dehydratase
VSGILRVNQQLAVGDTLPSHVIESVRADDIRLMALLLRDPNPIHFDLEAVARAGLGDRAINQGGATMAYVIDYVVAWAGSRDALRSVECSFRGNVAAGDDVSLGATVTDVIPSEDGDLVDLRVWADIVGGRRAIEGTAQVVRRAPRTG